jgi:LysR family transcriptional regulator, glycine cleavage system transcriptional activator
MLHCFDVCARHSNFVLAANELNVCPQAVGLQIRALEKHFGCRLFERQKSNAVTLTPVGHSLYLELARAFELIRIAIEGVSNSDPAHRLTVVTTPAFAAMWLVPRLGHFRAAHPRVEVRVVASSAPLAASSNQVDRAIVFAAEISARLIAETFLSEAIVPVCAATPFGEPAAHRLLHDDSPDRDPVFGSWTAWREAAGDARTTSDVRFDDPVLGLAAAQAGLSVWLARARLVAAPLRDGRLVRPFGAARRSSCSYRLVATPAAAERPAVKTFRHWLKAEAAQEELPD